MYPKWKPMRSWVSVEIEILPRIWFSEWKPGMFLVEASISAIRFVLLSFRSLYPRFTLASSIRRTVFIPSFSYGSSTS